MKKLKLRRTKEPEAEKAPETPKETPKEAAGGRVMVDSPSGRTVWLPEGKASMRKQNRFGEAGSKEREEAISKIRSAMEELMK